MDRTYVTKELETDRKNSYLARSMFTNSVQYLAFAGCIANEATHTGEIRWRKEKRDAASCDGTPHNFD